MRFNTYELDQVCSLAVHTQKKLVFDELLAAADKDITTKDVSRLRGWPVQDAFYVSAECSLPRKRTGQNVNNVLGFTGLGSA